MLFSKGGTSRRRIRERYLMVVIVMGVAGSGKTTVGQLLAQSLGWEFHDADDLHPRSNREKMHNGIALTDDDRRPWLEAAHAQIEQCLAGRVGAVVACSALKQWYRDLLVVNRAEVRLVYLKGERTFIEARLASRHGHFFDRELLASQFEALEEPRDAIVEDISREPQVMVESIRAKLGL
jgi:gluconokinase